MDAAAEICAALADDWLPSIYQTKIRTLRTRSIQIEVAERENAAIIQHTLLGIELKVARHRFACPDLATARYMRIFARIGCRSFAIPYDITRISSLADELETSWQRTLLELDRLTTGRPGRSVSIVRSRLIGSVRAAVNEIGAGEVMPAFDRETRQRKT